MMTRLYVVTDIMGADELLLALQGRAPLCVKVQKYAALGKKTLEAVWTEPVDAKIKMGVLSSEMACDESENLLVASGKLTDIKLATTVPGTKYRGSMELAGLYTDVLFDTQKKVGVIIEATDYARRRPKRVVELPQLELMANEEELVSDTVLKALGLPNELIKSRELLMELAKRQ